MIVSNTYRVGVVLLVLLAGAWCGAFTNDDTRVVAGGGPVQSTEYDGVWICGQGISGMNEAGKAGRAISSGNGRDCSASACTFFAGGMNQVVWNRNDADADGIIDENDLDDDNDGLSDSVELSGGAFSPSTGTDSMVADTDGDGADDYVESIAGTNPHDSARYLQVRMLEADSVTDSVVLQWGSRYGRTYRILRGDTVEELVSAPEEVAVVQALDGLNNPPWYEGVSTWEIEDGNTRSLYRVSVIRP